MAGRPHANRLVLALFVGVLVVWRRRRQRVRRSNRRRTRRKRAIPARRHPSTAGASVAVQAHRPIRASDQAGRGSIQRVSAAAARKPDALAAGDLLDCHARLRHGAVRGLTARAGHPTGSSSSGSSSVWRAESSTASELSSCAGPMRARPRVSSHWWSMPGASRA